MARASVLDTHPQLQDQWSKKNLRAFEDYSKGSVEKVWWECSEGHEWLSSLNNRTNHGNGCPFCSGLRPVLGVSDLKTRFPELMNEWHSDNAAPPESFTAFSNKKAKWQCEFGHAWITSINNRTASGSGCPECKGRTTPLIEVRILCSLSRYGAVLSHPRIEGEEVDILFGTELAIEYDGLYWHEQRGEKDIQKTQSLLRAGYSVVRLRENGLPPFDLHSSELTQFSFKWSRDQAVIDRQVDDLMLLLQEKYPQKALRKNSTYWTPASANP